MNKCHVNVNRSLLSNDNVPVAFDVTQSVTVKVHHQFPQSRVSGREVDFDFGVLPGSHGRVQSGGRDKYLYISLITHTLSHFITLNWPQMFRLLGCSTPAGTF